MLAWAELRKNEKSEFRVQISQADGSLIPAPKRHPMGCLFGAGTLRDSP